MTTTVSMSEAKDRLDELLAKAEAGEEIVITRDGRPVARLMAARRPLAFDELAKFRATMPELDQPSVELLREIRDEER